MRIGTVVLGFAAGFLAVLTVHQAVIAAGGALGFLAAGGGWSMQPVPPFGVPQVLSLAFWGGVWGVVLLAVADRAGRGVVGWLVPTLLLGLATTLVGWFVVGPLKGRPVGDLGLARLVTGLVINGAWALGALVIARLLGRVGLAR
ncbi:hypothetical protein [Alsobacter sp. R-9]